MEKPLKIRSYTWGKGDLSWSFVMTELLHAAEQLGHAPTLVSTNGTENMKYWDEHRLMEALVVERKMKNSKTPFDIDITFTVPQNFPQRFLQNSKVKMAIFDYESSHMPPRWKQFYHLVDYVLPASNYVAEMFKRNGCPEEKIKVVHHGVDLNEFNPHVPPFQLPTDRTFKFLCVAAPHYRKQLDRLLHVYCQRFTAKDDVSLIMKTKLFGNGDAIQGFEMDLRPTIIELKKKYGKNMPEIKFIQTHLPSMAGLYTAANAFVLMTASEGWGIPYLESVACGTPVIAPRHGGQLDFLHDGNALLCDTSVRLAKSQEQYWGVYPKATTGSPNEEHYGELMLQMYREYDHLKTKFAPEMKKTAESLTWIKAIEKIIDIAKQTGRI